MISQTPAGRSLLNEAAYYLISDAHPEELPLFVPTRDRYLADPAAFTRPVDAPDRPLGFGGAAVASFSQAVLPLLDQVLPLLLSAVATALQEDLKDEAVARVRKLFAKPEPIFNQKQLAHLEKEVNALVAQEAERLGITPETARAFKDALIARCALATKK